MKTLRCVEPGKLELIDLPAPEARQGYTRVRISRVGICGTDYHIFAGNQPYLSYPRVMGHELSGYAVENSSDGRIHEGELVVINPYLSCGNCGACLKGKLNCCEKIAVLGVHVDGGMCEEISIPDGNLYPAGKLSETAAAMVEFLAIGAHGVRRAGVVPGSTALVVGAGPIGLGAALFATIAGADVTLRDTSETRLALAAQIVAEARMELAGAEQARSYDVVFDATGSLAAINVGLQWVAHGGGYVLLSLVKGAFGFDDPEFHKRETTLYASRNALAADFHHVMAMMDAGRVPVALLASHETTLEGAIVDLPRWAADRGSVIKAIIRI